MKINEIALCARGLYTSFDGAHAVCLIYREKIAQKHEVLFLYALNEHNESQFLFDIMFISFDHMNIWIGVHATR